jgi:hypothetical protein
MVLLALFGAVMGQGVVWYTGQFYAQAFIENVCKINFVESRNILLIAILFATPFFVVFGHLSDKIGRKWIIMTGMLLAIFSYRPIYKSFLEWTDPVNKRAIVDASKTTTSPAVASIDAHDKKKMLVTTKYDTAYNDGAKFTFTKVDTLHLANDFAGKTASVGYIIPLKEVVSVSAFTETPGVPASKGDAAFVAIRNTDQSVAAINKVIGFDTVVVQLKAAKGVDLPEGITYVVADTKSAKSGVVVEKSLDKSTYWKMIMLVFVQILFVTMVYGPIAAFLVELFPTKIRYTSMSLPYHIGNGVFGGLVPFLGTLIVEFTKTAQNPAGDPLAGLWYPIGIAALSLIIGLAYLRNKIDENVLD